MASPRLPRSGGCLPVPPREVPFRAPVPQAVLDRVIASYKAVAANAQKFWLGPWSRTEVIQCEPNRLRQSTAAMGSDTSVLVQQSLLHPSLPHAGLAGG